MTTGRGSATRDVSWLRSRLPPPPPNLGGHRNGCRHRRGIPQDVPATESDDHHPKQKCDYDHGNRRDGHSPSTACLDLLHHLVHRLVVFHESKRCIDRADATERCTGGQAAAYSAQLVPSGSSTLASAAVTPVSLHLSSERLQTRFAGPNAPAKPRPESWGISCDPERRPQSR